MNIFKLNSLGYLIPSCTCIVGLQHPCNWNKWSVQDPLFCLVQNLWYTVCCCTPHSYTHWRSSTKSNLIKMHNMGYFIYKLLPNKIFSGFRSLCKFPLEWSSSVGFVSQGDSSFQSVHLGFIHRKGRQNRQSKHLPTQKWIATDAPLPLVNVLNTENKPSPILFWTHVWELVPLPFIFSEYSWRKKA